MPSIHTTVHAGYLGQIVPDITALLRGDVVDGDHTPPPAPKRRGKKITGNARVFEGCDTRDYDEWVRGVAFGAAVSIRALFRQLKNLYILDRPVSFNLRVPQGTAEKLNDRTSEVTTFETPMQRAEATTELCALQAASIRRLPELTVDLCYLVRYPYSGGIPGTEPHNRDVFLVYTRNTVDDIID